VLTTPPYLRSSQELSLRRIQTNPSAAKALEESKPRNEPGALESSQLCRVGSANDGNAARGGTGYLAGSAAGPSYLTMRMSRRPDHFGAQNQ
jgi:hypothetical protein